VSKKPTYEVLERRIAELENENFAYKRIEESLRKSEELYRLLAENVTDVIWVRDENLNLTYVSPSIQRLSGFTPEETVKQGFSDHLTPASMEMAQRITEEYSKVFFESPDKPIEPLTVELEDIRKGGSTGWSEVSMTFLRNPEGGFAGIVGISRDITDRKRIEAELEGYRDHLEELVAIRTTDLNRANEELQRQILEHERAEMALRESEERFRSVFEGSLDAILLVDPESGEILDANPTASELLMIPKEEIIGLHHSEITPTSLKETAEEAFSRVVQKEDQISPMEASVLRPDGTERYAEITAHIIQIDGRPVIHAVFRDTTEARRARAALHESEKKYRTLVETSEDMIALMRLDGTPQFVNRASIQTLGYSEEEFLNLKGWGYVHPEDIEHLLESMKPLRRGERVTNADYRYKTKDGSYVHLESTYSPVLDPQGNLVSYLAVSRDITEKRQVEKELAKVEKLESLGLLAGGIAHDFNNILTSILANISMVRMFGDLKEDISEMITDAETATVRAKGLTQQLLAFSKGGAPVKKPTSIAALIKDTAEFSLSGSNVGCEFSMEDDLWVAEVDEGQVGQVIHNVVINADQAMPTGGTIKIRAENVTVGKKSPLPLKEGRYVKVSIADPGIGISEKYLSRIFDPFYTTKEKGSGLGLSTSFTIINQHDGTITVDSEVGVGTTFHIFLPASEERLVVEKKERKKPKTGQGRILLVDDDESVRRSAGKILKRLGYQVKFAKDGAEGIRLYEKAMAKKQPFDIILMDLTIPGGMGGKEAIEKLLKIDPGAKAIVSSGYSDDRVLSNFEEYGFYGAVTKPYRIDELAEVINSAVGDSDLLPSAP
jgi:PAS domain S-box-containing protein